MKRKNKRKLAALILVLLLVFTAFREPLIKIAKEATFYWFDHTETELAVKAYAEEHGLYFSDYPENLVELLERNPETEKFVLEYPLYRAEAYDLSEYADSAAVPLFLQWDQRWGYENYGSDMIAITGCGPTCLAMVGYYLTEDAVFTPAAVAEFAEENGYYAAGYGSSWTLISEGGPRLGLSVKELPLDEGVIRRQLQAGNPVICAMGPGYFTTAGHYIVLTGLVDGAYTVNDPNSVANSEKPWTYEEISGQIRNLWAVSAE